MRTKTAHTTSIHEVRREVRGGRADPTRMAEAADARETRYAGQRRVVPASAKGNRRGASAAFLRLKSSVMVVHPMEAQLRLLLDANVAGEARVFGLESLAAGPLFVRLAGGVVPSIDTVYRDLCRFDDGAISELETMMASKASRRYVL